MVKKRKKHLPDKYKKSVFEIDFFSLYNAGFRVVFLDIDISLIYYTKAKPTKKVIELIADIEKIGFEIVLISNNYKKRVKIFAEPLNKPAVHYAMKPFKCGYKRGLKKLSEKYSPQQIISVGDQLLTDVRGSNKMGFYTILVKPLERKSDVWTTKINRFLERRIIRKIKKKYPKLYEERLQDYESL